MVDVQNLNGLGWTMGDWGGLFFFLRPSANSGEITPGQKELLDTFLRRLPSFSRWDEAYQVYVMADPNPNYPAAVGFTNEGVYVEYDYSGGQWGEDMEDLKAFAATLGLGPYDLDTDNTTFVPIDAE